MDGGHLEYTELLRELDKDGEWYRVIEEAGKRARRGNYTMFRQLMYLLKPIIIIFDKVKIMMDNSYRAEKASVSNMGFIHEFFLHYDVVYDDDTKMMEMIGFMGMAECPDKVRASEYTVVWSCEAIDMLLDYQLPMGRTFLLVPVKIWSQLHRFCEGINLLNATVLYYPHNGEHVCLMNMLDGRIRCVVYLVGMVT